MPHHVKPPKTKNERWQANRDRIEAMKNMTPQERGAYMQAEKPDWKTAQNPGGALEALPVKDR